MEDRQEYPCSALLLSLSLCVCVCVCVAGVHCCEISLGSADPWNVTFCLSCLILGFSLTFIVPCRLFIMDVLLCCIVFCVFVALI